MANKIITRGVLEEPNFINLDIRKAKVHSFNFDSWDVVNHWSDPAFKHFFKKAKLDFGFLFKKVKVYSSRGWVSFVVALVLLLLLFPVFLVVMLGIVFTMPGRIFYRQTRVGRNGKLFSVLKFRSMIENAESCTGHTLSWDGDPRVTWFGRFLRKTHIDELPQLINILKGDMCFIGPRPERPEFTTLYSRKDSRYCYRHMVKPGITGLAQMACPYDASVEEKLGYDLMYVAARGAWMLDMLIVFHTIKKMVLMKNTAGIVDRSPRFGSFI